MKGIIELSKSGFETNNENGFKVVGASRKEYKHNQYKFEKKWVSIDVKEKRSTKFRDFVEQEKLEKIN